jgi:putative copper resistance protein D
MTEDLLIFVRFLHFAAVMSLFGASLFPLYALSMPVASVSKLMRQKAPLAAALALLSALAWLSLEGRLMSGQPAGYADPHILGTVLHSTQFGHIWQWRLGVLVLLAGFAAMRLASEGWYTRGLAILSAVAVATLAGVGHGAMGVGRDAWLHLGNQAAHMLAASVWVGGLAALLVLVRGRVENLVLMKALRRFSSVGLAVVLVILASGLLNSWFLVGSLEALFSSPYGQVLMCKLFFFSIMIVLAFYNRLVFLPKLDGSENNLVVQRLIRSVALEQACALLVVAVVSVLGTLEPAFAMVM